MCSSIAALAVCAALRSFGFTAKPIAVKHFSVSTVDSVFARIPAWDCSTPSVPAGEDVWWTNPWSSKVEALEAKTEALEAKMEADNKEFRAALRALQAKSTSA